MTLPLIIDALAFASHAHRDQRRKGLMHRPTLAIQSRWRASWWSREASTTPW